MFFQVRAELSAVRHMGIIPRIHFIHYAGLEKGKDVLSVRFSTNVLLQA